MDDPSSLKLPAGDPGLPGLRNNLAFVRGPADFRAVRQAAHGPIFRAHLFGNDVAFLASPESIGWALRSEGDAVENEWLGNVNRILGAGCTARLLGADHKRRRRLLAPHFSASGLASLAPTLESVIQRHIRGWIGQEIVLVDRIRALTFEVISRYVLGDLEALSIDLEALSEDFTAMVAGLFSLPIDLPFTRLGRGRVAVERLHRIFTEAAAQRRAAGGLGEDALSSLLQVRDDDGAPLPDADVAAELVLLLFAGHETTVTSLTNLVVLLAEHPAILDRLIAEQEATGDAPPTPAGLRRRPFTRACVDESMRRFTPIAAAFRRVQRDVAVEGFRIPAGWMLGLSFPAVHMDPEIWTEPERFDPDRFLAPRLEHEARRYAFVPFGGGPRICLGQHFAILEMHLIVRALALGCRWTLSPDQDLTRTQMPVPIPKSGGIVRIEARPGGPLAGGC